MYRNFETAPVDHGWAWVVLLSSFCVSAVVDGVGFSVGVLFSSLQKEFTANNQQISWVSSVLNGTYLLIGPVVSFFVNRHGCRKVALLGCVMAAVSFSLSTFSCSIELVILVYGLVGGVGLGFLYQPSVVIVGHYFYARRALALGIMACGSGIGAFAFAPLFSFFVECYGWRGATHLAAALVLLCFFVCITYKPLIIVESSADLSAVFSKPSPGTCPRNVYVVREIGSVTEISSGKEMLADTEGTSFHAPPIDTESVTSSKEVNDGEEKGLKEGTEEKNLKVEELVPCNKLREKTLLNGDHMSACCSETGREERQGLFVKNIQKDMMAHVTCADGKETESLEDSAVFGDDRSPFSVALSCKDKMQMEPTPQSSDAIKLCIDENTSNLVKNNLRKKDYQKALIGEESVLPVVLNEKDIDGRNGITALSLSEEKVTEERNGNVTGSLSEVSKRNCSDFESHINNISDVTISAGSATAESSCRRCFRRLVWLPVEENLRLMKRPSAIVYGVVCFLMSVGMYVPTTFLPPMAEQLNFEASKGAFLVSAIGIGNVIGRLLTGLIAHYYPCLVMGLNHSSLILAGLSTCLLPLLTDYYLMIGYSMLFGACIGVFVVLQLMVLIELLGFDHLTNAFGVVNVYHGVGTFVGPPLAGFIADATGGLNSAFYAIGAAFTLAGLISLPLHRTSITECRTVKASSGSVDLRMPNFFCSEQTEEGRKAKNKK
ncbi:hypothetical protein ACOMHN_017531 [Nucella lapillus]